jgi:hypothetical protein
MTCNQSVLTAGKNGKPAAVPLGKWWLVRIGEAAIRESTAKAALAVGEGQREQARRDRTSLSIASRELQALIVEAQS